ncbi:MAG: pentapeptide repeat-containing protein [Pseudonocardiaceae bacterium]
MVVPAAGPGQEEIIQVSPEGLRRFSAYGTTAVEQPVLIECKWRAVGGAFATTPRQELAAGESELVAATEQPEPTPLADPHSLFLDRIEEVCKTGYERVQILRVETDPPHLLVTRPEGELNPQWRIGAHVGALSRDAVDGFLRYEPGPGSELVYEGPPPARELREEALRRGVRVRSFLEFQGLLDLSGYLDKQTNRLRTDPRYPPELYVPQRFRELDGSDPGVRDDLAEELIDLVTADYARFVLLLGDFGGGKTFALREVARRIAETKPHLIPILIELRGLDKAHTVHGLVAAHLANDNEGLANFKAFDYMLGEGRIILLFDGFDELVTRLTYDRAAEHLHTLLAAVQDQAKVVVAGRTQHFKSTAQVLTALGQRVDLLPHRRILTVEGFSSTRIRMYLVNRFGGDYHKADSRVELIREIQNLLDLAQNPRMLCFIAELEEDRLRAAADARNKISAAGLYRQILESWLSYEANRAVSPGAATTLRLDDLRKAVTTLALRLWEAGESHLRLPALTEVAEALSGLADGQLSADQTAFAMGRDSLLVRTEEEQFGFIHSSVVEWLVADTIAEQLNSGVLAPPQLHQRPLSQLTVAFLGDLADTRACQVWADSVSSSADVTDAARANAYKVSARLHVQPTADMRGASLKGEDLSYRDLRGVDLTGADLTGASLVGANLRGAILRDAALARARLDEAQLNGADLTGADFRHARLFQADLTGVIMARSRWSRAALIDTTAVPDVPERYGAAVAPGDPVETELAPASIGVRHGFDAELGRLPQVLDYSPDGGMLAIGSDGGGVLICDTSTGLPLRTLPGHRGRVFAVAYGEDILVTGSDDGTVRIWDAATGHCRYLLEGHEQWSWPVAISASGQELATGDANGVLRLWDLKNGSLRRELSTGRGLIFSLAFTGRLIAAAYRDGSALLWNTVTGETRDELTGATGSVYRVAVCPGHGGLLATGGSAGTVRLWDPATGQLRAELRGHTGRVYTLAFHPHEPLLASGDTDGGVRLWDAATDQLRHLLSGHPDVWRTPWPRITAGCVRSRSTLTVP